VTAAGRHVVGAVPVSSVATRDRYDGTMEFTEHDTVDQQLDGAVETAVADDELVDELLIEEISIDGMCGVY
jgi:mycofactocin precursor